VAVLVAVAAVVVIGFAALAVDVGVMYNAKAELQRAADASALAGASGFFTDAGLKQDTAALPGIVGTRSSVFSAANETLKQSTILELADMTYGRHDFDNPSSGLTNATPWNSVQVQLRKTEGSSNGAVPLFFARVFGRNSTGTTSMARAAVDDRVAGYRIVEGGDFVPFTIHEDIYNDLVVNGPDGYAYNDPGVNSGGDGIPEVKLFPWKWTVEDDALYDLNITPADKQNDASGNFGTLNIGIDNQGSTALEDQILNGVTADQLTAEFGTTELLFHDENGAHTYESNGNTGLSATLKSTLSQRIGDVVGFFVHSSTYDTGAGAQFVISGIRFARIMNVRIHGNPNERAISLQPVATDNSYFIVNEYAPSSDGQMGRVYLVR
jgi:hypothetical protein